jgi:hypothetical protein
MYLSLAMQIRKSIILGKTSYSTALLALSTKRFLSIEKAHLGQDHVFVFKTSFFICAFFLPNIKLKQLLPYYLQRSLTWGGAILVSFVCVWIMVEGGLYKCIRNVYKGSCSALGLIVHVPLQDLKRQIRTHDSECSLLTWVHLRLG